MPHVLFERGGDDDTRSGALETIIASPTSKGDGAPVAETPQDLDLHLIVDKYATHERPKVMAWA